MKLKKLHIRDFRNIKEAEISVCDRFNLFFGRNAQGKTNLLESIYLLGAMKSFRTAKNMDLISWTAGFSILKGWVERDKVTREISLLLNEEGKKARIDSKSPATLSDFFGHLNVVVFSPEEITMVKGQPDQRRKYLDRAVFCGDVGYLALHHEYHRALKNRNALLKMGDKSGLEIWSQKLAESGCGLIEKRVAYLGEIGKLLREFYSAIAGIDENATIRYNPHLIDAERVINEGSPAFMETLARTYPEEARRGFTQVGPHRDDIEFSLAGRGLRSHGSQGELRSYILALKMAEIEYIQRKHGSPPILLLDDITSELDGERNLNLIRFLDEKEMQVFITTTDLANINTDIISRFSAFQVENGKILQ